MKISVITTCYNSAATIADTLKSVDAQTWGDKEHWIVDGASRDDTLVIIEAHARPWRHVHSNRDNGIYDAMNKGLKFATGEVVGLLNSDDFYASPTVLEMVAKVFDDPAVDACWGDLCYVKQEQVDQVVRYWRSSPFRPGLFRTGWCPPHPTLFIRRAVYDRLGRFDLRYSIAADVELMARFLEVNRIGGTYIPQVLVHMRMGGASNRSLGNVLLLNRQIWQAFRELGIDVSLLGFVGGKILSRARQFLSRPAT